MKKIITIILFLGLTITGFAQNTSEDEIRKLEDIEREAFLKGDTITLYKLFSPNYVVNAHRNKVITLQDVKTFKRTGQSTFEIFDRFIEKITFTENLAIVMGREVVQTNRKDDNPDKKITRRYTNVWVKHKEGWILTTRQETNICE